MKKSMLRVFALVAICLSICNLAIAKISIVKSRSATTLRVSVDTLDFKDTVSAGTKFTNIKLSGVDKYSGIIYQPGKPEIPVVRFIVTGEEPIIIASDEQKITLPKRDLPLKPLQPSLPKIPGAKAAFQWDKKAYKKNAFYPAKTYEIRSLGTVRGTPQMLITLYPIAYNPVLGTIQFRNNYEIRLPKGGLVKDIRASGSTKEGIVFVVGKKFSQSPSLQKYLTFKKNLGFDVKVLPMGNDVNTPDEIRDQLKQIYSSGSFHLDHVILIGDAEDVPGYTSKNISGTTDLYYSALDTENYEDDILSPDVGVGRFSASNEIELGAIVDKSIAYHQGIFSNEHWLTQAAFIATDDRYEVAEASHNYAIEKYTAPIGYTGIFPSAAQAGGDKLYAVTYRVPNNIVQQAMQEGRTIIDYSGHGSETYWVAPSVTQNDVRALNSDSALPFVISNACNTGDFRVSEAFAETWNRHRYGAILFWGSMDSTYWDEDDILEKRMFDGIYAENKMNFRDITHYALAETARFYGGAGRSKYYWETYTMFGDPSIRLRTSTTQTASIEGLTEIPVGFSPLEYFVKDSNGKPLINTRVTILTKNNDYIDSFTTDSSGKFVFIPNETISAGVELKVLVTGQNLRQSELALQFISPNAPYLNLRNLVVNGRSELLAAAGEELGLAMSVTNIGTQGTQGAMLGIESVTGPATIIAGSTGLATIGAGQSMNLDPSLFRIRVNANANRGELIVVNFLWTTNEGTTGRSVKVIPVAKANLETIAVDFGASTIGSGIRPGSSGNTFLTIKNTGNETLWNAQLFPKNGACVDSGSGVLEIAKLLPGESIRISAPIELLVSSTCQNGDLADITFLGNYQGIAGLTPISLHARFQVGVIAQQEIASTNIGLTIPDNGAAVEHLLQMNNTGNIMDLGVHVKITHPYIGDIILTLVHPDGTEVLLRENEGSNTNNLDIVYGLGGTTVEDLKNLAGKPMQGAWKIRVQDNASSDIGTLDFVKLVFKGFVN